MIAASEIMTTKLKTLHPKDDIFRAIEIFEKYDIHHIPIMVSNTLVGIISQGDVLAHNKREDLGRYYYPNNVTASSPKIEDVMSKNIVTVQEDSELTSILSLLIKHKINCLPVFKDEGIAGIITSCDIYKTLKNILEKN